MACTVRAKSECVSMNNDTFCFGQRLTYSSTSFDLVSDANNLREAENKLLLWSGLKSVPRCWDVIQPLLCSVYLPKCENQTIHLPDRSLCTATRSPCRIVDIEQGWPNFLQCDNDNFQDNCPLPKVEFNTSSCEKPLIETANPASWYRNVEGCGMSCKNPLFTEEDHEDMHRFIAIWATITILLTLFAMMSFRIDWSNSSKYPTRIVFFINLCFFLSCFGWLAQFVLGREEIVCRKDGTMRLEEPVGSSESAWCVIVFILVYFFALAGISWFVLLAFSWHRMFKLLRNNSRQPSNIKPRHMHLVAWAIPGALVIGSVAVSQIDGDSMSGICFIGYKNHWYRLGFLLIPVGIAMLVGGYYLFAGIYALFTVKHGNEHRLSTNNLEKINWTMIRLGIFIFCAFVFVLITFAAHTYDITHQHIWERSYTDYIRCEANITILEKLNESIHDPASNACVLKQRPLVSVMKLHLVALFGTGIIMSTWVWTKASMMNWRRLFLRWLGRSDSDMRRIRHKSEMIAKAFANRQRKNTEQLSELEYSEQLVSHADPVAMDIDFDSITDELSRKFVKNVPNFVVRRGGIVPHAQSVYSAEEHNNPTCETTRNVCYTMGSQVWAITNNSVRSPPLNERGPQLHPVPHILISDSYS